jgi:glycerol-3-phosphate acyltransferase PlsY
MKSAAERPLWFPAAPAFDHDAATRKEQGTRAAGAAVGPLFERYFGVQAVCAILCLVTALSLSGPGRDQRWRVYLISVATLTVAVGWGLDWKVTRLREVRDQAQDAALLSTGDWSHDEAVAAVRADFTRWHLASLLVNFLTIGCVTVAMALAGRLPDDTQPVLRPSDGGPRA